MEKQRYVAPEGMIAASGEDPNFNGFSGEDPNFNGFNEEIFW